MGRILILLTTQSGRKALRADDDQCVRFTSQEFYALREKQDGYGAVTGRRGRQTDAGGHAPGRAVSH